MGRQHYPQPWTVQSLTKGQRDRPSNPTTMLCGIWPNIRQYKVLCGSTEKGLLSTRKGTEISKGVTWRMSLYAWHLQEWGLVLWGQGRGTQSGWFVTLRGIWKWEWAVLGWCSNWGALQAFSVGGRYLTSLKIFQCPRRSFATKNCAVQNVNCISTGR